MPKAKWKIHHYRIATVGVRVQIKSITAQYHVHEKQVATVRHLTANIEYTGQQDIICGMIIFMLFSHNYDVLNTYTYTYTCMYKEIMVA